MGKILSNAQIRILLRKKKQKDEKQTNFQEIHSNCKDQIDNTSDEVLESFFDELNSISKKAK